MSEPKPPYYGVIFINQRSEGDDGPYISMAERMVELAQQQPGYLGVETVRDETGKGITISYWESMDAIKAWKKHPEHLNAQHLGMTKWYDHYQLQIVEVQSVKSVLCKTK